MRVGAASQERRSGVASQAKATFDGDMCSADIVYSQNGRKEIDALLSDINTYLDPRGGFRASTSTDTVDLVLNNLTGDPA